MHYTISNMLNMQEVYTHLVRKLLTDDYKNKQVTIAI